MVMISPLNTYGCEELKANGHGCVFMPYVPQFAGRPFHLFVRLHNRGSRYMGRFEIVKATTRAVGVKAWENLPLEVCSYSSHWDAVHADDVHALTDEAFVCEDHGSAGEEASGGCPWYPERVLPWRPTDLPGASVLWFL